MAAMVLLGRAKEDAGSLRYRMECYSRLVWYRLEMVEVLGVEDAYVRYLGQLARRYVE
jgi:hypothetical protein